MVTYESGFEGDWTNMFREIVLMNADWMRGVELSLAMSKVRGQAQRTDTEETRASLLELRQALERLDRQCEIYAQQARRLKAEVAMMTAAVHAKHSVHVDPEHADNGIPDEDELLERMSDLYGLPKPRRYR